MGCTQFFAVEFERAAARERRAAAGILPLSTHHRKQRNRSERVSTACVPGHTVTHPDVTGRGRTVSLGQIQNLGPGESGDLRNPLEGPFPRLVPKFTPALSGPLEVSFVVQVVLKQVVQNAVNQRYIGTRSNFEVLVCEQTGARLVWVYVNNACAIFAGRFQKRRQVAVGSEAVDAPKQNQLGAGYVLEFGGVAGVAVAQVPGRHPRRSADGFVEFKRAQRPEKAVNVRSLAQAHRSGVVVAQNCVWPARLENNLEF